MVKAKSKSNKQQQNALFLAMVVGVTICATLALSWMIFREVYIASTRSAQENQQNVVVNTVGASQDLVNALLAEKSGCDTGKNTEYIVRQSGNFALVHYGCELDAYMFYKKDSGKWTALNPTNNFIYGVPLCSHVKQYSIPVSVQAYCYDAPTKDGKLPIAVPNPVK